MERAPWIEDSTFHGSLWVWAPGHATDDLLVRRNRFVNDAGWIAVNIGYGTAEGRLAPGQIVDNWFESQLVQVYSVDGPGAIPLGSNYWGDETPTFTREGTTPETVTVDFGTILADPPPAGATW